jgi:DNA-binding transcriptional ArsR family regulator
MTESSDDSFTSSKAEVFEALGHPTRIRILQELAARPLTYSELKRAAGLESNGLLTFHLGKMRDLVKLNAEGNYALTDEGREALRVIETSRTPNPGRSPSPPALHLPRQKAVIAVLLVALIVLGSVAVYEQEQITTLNKDIPSDVVTVNGTRYWYLNEPLYSVILAKSIIFDGVNFTSIMPNASWYPTAALLTEYNVSAYSRPNSNLSLGIPEIAVSFSTGTTEYWNPFTVTMNNNYTWYPSPSVKEQGQVIITFTQPPNRQPPNTTWLTKQTNPSAGIEWDNGSGILTFYVSVN